jgi:hypothetical protein
MKLRNFKSLFFKPLQLLDESKLEKDLSNDEIYSLFKTIISGVHGNLRKYGFRKEGANNSFRISEEIYQSLNFQKSSYNDCFTININIRPIYWHRPEIFYLLSTRRVGNFETGKDKWYEINKDTKSTIEHVTTVIETLVMPVFEKTRTSAQIVTNQDLLIKNKVYHQDVMLFSAMRIEDRNLSKRLLTEVVEVFERDDRTVEWVVNDREYFRNLKKLAESEKWTEIQKELDLNKTNFYQLNKKIAKIR